MSMPRLRSRWGRLGLLLLLLVGVAMAWIGWRAAPGAAVPLQGRFVRHGTNRWTGWNHGFSNLVFELHNPGISPLYVRGHGKYSDWPLAEALSTRQVWALDYEWYSTNQSPVIPPGGSITLEVFAQAHDPSPDTRPEARGLPLPGFTTFMDSSRVWRFRFKARGVGPLDALPHWLRAVLPPDLIPEPRYRETRVDVEIPMPAAPAGR
jgi:hypothetical protein